MIRRTLFFLSILAAFVACSDDDSFTTSSSARLTFSTDSVKMDTIFSNVGSRTYDFWVYNHAGDGLRLQSVRLAQGNQTGFRVNVDGSYLDNSLGSVVTDLEVRKGDSIRVFVELTARETGALDPQMIEDKLVFRLESGVEQQVVLQGCTWDALPMQNVVVRKDSVIESKKPIIIYGGLRVDSAATLTIKNTTLYFHDGPGIEVYGKLLTDNVLMRGDRLDHMFDYLPYDRVSGQWGKDGGIIFYSSSTRNVLQRTEIRNAGKYGIRCDSAEYTPNVRRLDMYRCIIHNCKGAGLVSYNANIRLRYCQLSNTQGDCLAVYGGKADVNRCTFAQFYPFVGGRGAALRFSNILPLHGMNCDSSIVTGYDEDVVMGVIVDTLKAYNFQFSNTLLRTPYEEGVDTLLFEKVIWESPKDSIQGKKHFILVDEDNLKYDFHLDSLSTAKGLGCYD